MPTTPEAWRDLTGLVVGILVVVALSYTTFARVFGGNDATISMSIQSWAKMWPVIAFAAGFTCGHIFWPTH